MKILLINPPIRLDRPPECFPFGLGYVASVLLKEGHNVQVLDINALRMREDDVLKKIEKSDFDVVGIGGIVTTYKYLKWLTSEIKKMRPKIKIILGGGVGSSIPHLAFKNMAIDFIVDKEGEQTIVELLDNLGNPKKVKGIYYKEDDVVCKTQDRKLIENLDTIPFPAWDLFSMDVYTNPLPSTGWLKTASMIYGRGCPYNCTFCWHNFGRGNRLRSPENVIEEMKMLKEKFNVKYISFYDECLTTNKENVLNFCSKLADANLGLKWSSSSRVNLIDEEILTAMKKAGCNYIEYGIESGSQRMLDVMNKGTTVEQAKKAVLLTKKAGMMQHASFMIGTPQETKETICDTVRFCKEVGLPHRIEIFFTTPFPSTTLYECAKEKNLITDEDKYIEKLGNVIDFAINLTDMPDEELIRLRDNAEKEASASLLERVVKYYQFFGPSALIKSGINILNKKLSTTKLSEFKLHSA